MKLPRLAALLIAAVLPGQAFAAELFVYRGAGCTGLRKLPPFTAMAGRAPDGVTDFTERTRWQDMLNSANWNLDCWAGTPYRLSQAVPMLLDKGTTLTEGARGAYDQHYARLARLLVKKGQADAYLRIGWEFNGDWYPWSAAKDPEAFVQYFRRIVKVMRAVPGQKFRIVWNPSQGKHKIAPDTVYPGDDVVDIVALDLYNTSWRKEDADPEVRWRNTLTQPYSLNWLRDFAARHNKPMALPEWGTGTSPNGQGQGDDPLFIRRMGEWIRANNVAYHGYWDYPAADYNAELSGGRQPKSAKAFREAFGPRGE
jgi:hypothetical protein